MKKTLSAALVLILLVGLLSASAAPAGSSLDPLATLRYLSDTFYNSLMSAFHTKYDNTLGARYENAQEDLDAAYRTHLARLGALDGYTPLSSPTSYTLYGGQTAQLLTGSTFVPLSGLAMLTVSQGEVINVSTGEIVQSGTYLTNGLRYLCAEDTVAVVSAGSTLEILFEGFCKTTAMKTVLPLPFLDMTKADWFYPAVEYAVGRELFKGTGERTFSPGSSMTRAMFVTVLYRLAGQPYVSTASMAFTDVADPSSYYYNAVAWASQNGIVTGYVDGSFRPDASITREQMAAIMYRYADFAGYSVQIGSTEKFDAFPDSVSVADWATSALMWATDRGIINGADGMLLPTHTATRAQVAQIIMNFGNTARI
ncbi:MAG TPA: S-layer homology domain-containing protein [Papillibacter sp.]|nr:S-layer homology domain-containing protein [Papillibacter sp.]